MRCPRYKRRHGERAFSLDKGKPFYQPATPFAAIRDYGGLSTRIPEDYFCLFLAHAMVIKGFGGIGGRKEIAPNG